MASQELKKISKSELLLNNGEDGNKLWILIEGKVYDVTEFSHPGGIESLLDNHGEDRFDEFESIHSPAAKKELAKHLIGEYQENSDSQSTSNRKTETDKKTDNIKIKTESKYLPGFIIIGLLIAFVVYKFLLGK